MLPIFESSTSTLYYSNDGRLQVRRYRHPEDVRPDGTPMALPRWVYSIDLHADNAEPVEVFTTYDPVKSDAYIAGYDLARERA